MKVLKPVVARIAVQVPALLAIHPRANERVKYKMVDKVAAFLSILGKGDSFVAVLVGSERPWHPFAAAAHGVDSSLIADLIQTFVSHDGRP